MATARVVGRVSVRVMPDTSRFKKDLQKSLERLERVLEVKIPTSLNTKALNEEAVRAKRRLEQTLGNVDTRVNIDTERGEATIGRLARDRTATINTRVDLPSLARARKAITGLVTSIGSSLSSAAKRGLAVGTLAAAVSTLGAAAAASVVPVLQLTAALAPAAGAITALPGAIALTIAGMTTLRLALVGVGDAFSAAMGNNVEKFKESLQQLSPAARKVVIELRKLRPTLLGIQQVAQNALFRPLRGELTATVKVLNKPLRASFKALGTEIGLAGRELARFARSAETVKGLQSIFFSATRALSFLRPALQPLLGGFRDLALVGARFLASLTPAIGAAVASFGRFLSLSARSGDATRWMTDALAVLQQLFRILSNVGSIFASVFRTASETGGGLLNTLERITGQFADFLKSAEGVRALRGIFRGLGDVGRALGPVFVALVKGLGQIAPAAGRIAQVVGPILTRAIEALAPALAALEPGITALVTGLGGAVTALAPALVPLANALSRIAAAAAPLLAKVAGALAPALLQLEPGITALVNGLGGLVDAVAPALVPVAAALSGIAAGLAPVLPALGQLVATLAQGLATHIQNMLPVLPQLVDAIVKLGLALGVNLLRVIEQLGPQLPALVVAFSDLLLALIPVLPPLADFLIALVPLIPIVTDVVKLLADLANFVMPALRNSIELNAKSLKIFLDAVKWTVDQVYRAFSWLFDVLVGHSIIPDLVNGITRWFRDGARWMVDAVSSGIKKVAAWFGDLPRKITDAVGNLGSLLYSSGRSVVQGLINGILSMLGRLADAASRVAGTIARHLPGSPVKEGPLRVLNRGHAGGQIAKMIADGMTQGEQLVARASSHLASAAVLSPVMATAATGAASGADFDYRRLATAMSNVTVRSFLDGKEVTDVVDRNQGRTTQLRRRTR